MFEKLTTLLFFPSSNVYLLSVELYSQYILRFVKWENNLLTPGRGEEGDIYFAVEMAQDEKRISVTRI